MDFADTQFLSEHMLSYDFDQEFPSLAHLVTISRDAADLWYEHLRKSRSFLAGQVHMYKRNTSVTSNLFLQTSHPSNCDPQSSTTVALCLTLQTTASAKHLIPYLPLDYM